MLRNLTFCLAVAGVGFGIATGSAAAIDREQSKVSGAVSVVPAEGKFSSGFSAIKSPGRQNLKEGSSAEAQDAGAATMSGLVRPEGDFLLRIFFSRPSGKLPTRPSSAATVSA